IAGNQAERKNNTGTSNDAGLLLNESNNNISMASLSSSPKNQQEPYGVMDSSSADRSSSRMADTRWSDIDKYRLYSFGTVMYSALTVILHPLTVAKIRRQILMHGPSSSSSSSSTTPTASSAPIHSSTAAANTTITSTSPITNYIRQYYRGLGVVVALAIPARIIYISTLEYTRECVDTSARQLLLYPPPFLLRILSSSYSSSNSSTIDMSKYLPLVTPLSGGIAGGLAAVSSQLIVVPMDVISQKLIVMDDSVYNTRGRAMQVAQTIVQTDGWRGLYKGFGLSLFTSLPAGSIWWATYAGLRNHLNSRRDGGGSDDGSAFMSHSLSESRREEEAKMLALGSSLPPMARQCIIQLVSAFGAAAAASVVTQPLDTLKTRIQVGSNSGSGGVNGGMTSTSNALSYAITRRKQRGFLFMAKELSSTSGVSGLYKGLLPRIVHMGVWGSVLSAAYEVLKLVSRKDFEV
ncbi:hypothetical protein ACHAXH_000660, partial [Discostella pseudostelligera]